jgi:Domain of unknown function (DUF5658)
MSNEERVGDDSVADISVGDRRETTERRTLTFETILRGSVRARRRSSRRRDDSYHIDWHEPDLLFLSVTTVLLSVIDAFLTLTLLRHGAEEANPLLAYVLTYYPELFATLKMLMTGMGVLVLVAMARLRLFRVIRVKTVLQWSLLGYVVLIGYELWLLRGAI